jgi:hypothetical protein
LKPFIALCAVIVPLSFGTAFAEVTELGKNDERKCNNRVSLIIDNDELWTRSLDDLRKQDNVVHFTEGRQKGKRGISLASLMLAASNVQAVEVSTCNRKLRRFDAEELAQKQDSLYFIITKYRGLKLHNEAGGEKKKKGSKLKHIDRIRLITQPE